MWRQSWWLVGKELKFQWQAFVATIFATFIVSLAAVSVLIPVVSDGEFNIQIQNDRFLNEFLLDFVFIGLAPSLSAIFMASPYLSFKSIKEDPFSKRMAVYRTLPVPLTVLARSRVLLMIVTLTTMSVVFYTSIIGIIANFSGTFLSLETIVMMIMFWFGYALLAGSLNNYIEFGTNGKMLWIYPIVYVSFIIVLMLLVQKTKGYGLVEWTLSLIQTHGLWLAIASLLAGVIGCFGMVQLLKRRLVNKDYM